MEPITPVIDGVKVKMGGKEWIIPPLNFKQLKRLQPKLEKFGGLDPAKPLSDEQMDGMVEIIHEAMSRNYSELTAEEVAGLLDLGNMKSVFPAVMGVSGLEKKPGEEKGPESR